VEIERGDGRPIKKRPQEKEGDVRVVWGIASESGLDGDNAVA
jgi:hypothetical protein